MLFRTRADRTSANSQGGPEQSQGARAPLSYLKRKAYLITFNRDTGNVSQAQDICASVQLVW